MADGSQAPAPVPTQPNRAQPPAPVPTQPYGAQPAPVNYRALHGYGPGIPDPEDIVPNSASSFDGKWHVVTRGTEIMITGSWAVAASRAVGVPGGLYKSKATWQKAIDYYTDNYRDGNIKLVEPRNPSATPGRSTGRSTSTSTAHAMPTSGTRTMPTHVISSPAIHVTTNVHIGSSPAASPGVATPHRAVQRTPVAGHQDFPIVITSSPIVAPVMTPAQSAETIKRHRNIEKAFAKMKEKDKVVISEPTTPPSEPAAWRDPTPVSIPGARTLSRAISPATTYVPPSTPTKPAKGKGKMVANDDSDIDYFPEDDDFTDEQLLDLFEWEQTLMLQQALSSPRFD